jgi:hypothetical protein
MVAIITVLTAFPLGYLVRSRLAANTAYAVAYLWAFVFQTLYLILDVINDSNRQAFEPQKFPWAYGVVTLSIFTAGFGLVALGHLVRARRLARSAQPVGAPA